MKLSLPTFIAILVLSVNACADEVDVVSQQEGLRGKYTQFKKRYSIYFNGIEEDEYRFAVFKENMAFIEKTNNRNLSYRLAVNQYSAMTDEEFASRNGSLFDPETGYTSVEGWPNDAVENISLTSPTSIDWVELGAVNAPLAQGKCGACYAMAALDRAGHHQTFFDERTGCYKRRNKHLDGVCHVLGDTTCPDHAPSWSSLRVQERIRVPSRGFGLSRALESAMKIQSGLLERFSVQQIIDCSQSLGNKGCYGGSRTLAQKYVSENGIVSDAAYAYTAKDEVCRQVVQDKTKQCLRKGDISPAKSVTIDSNRLNLLSFELAKGPIAVAVANTAPQWKQYKNGILKDFSCNGAPNHAMLLVGYGTENGVGYWKLRNSEGTGWGENGYVRIFRDPKAFAVYYYTKHIDRSSLAGQHHVEPTHPQLLS
ncbi:hypothetical protein FOL47_005977 [Perkinsus chesapeaki]|uniref:Uncharacterized protein n=1 Tax=Perkinsus chesapeaki TaxID=330153 RepID=A0A7J6LUT5_PERCH|nr:hypothetical protein FOL47_005977 [Perkinsus chesapeaki]